jgi:superfamily II DNA/RNA helicase
VQESTIPRIIKGDNIVMAAATGSGKTLAYCLPIIQQLQAQEEAGYSRLAQRPRVLILVPTRELARQVLESVKQLSHFHKVASTAVMGGESYRIQRLNVRNCDFFFVLFLFF